MDSNAEEVRKHPLARCEGCPWRLKSGFADASGPLDASIVVVGEAPGRTEIDTGIPFSGPSGILLDKVLAHHRIDRDLIRFTNVVACHPPYSPGQPSVVPPKDVIACCAPRLTGELEGKETVIALGNTAHRAVTGTVEAITSARVGPPKLVRGRRVISTFHPAACLRSADYFPSLVRDIGKVHSTVRIKWEEPKFVVLDTPSAAVDGCRQLNSRRGAITIDIECGVEKDTSFTHPNELLCVGVGYEPGKVAVFGENALRHPGARMALRGLLRTKEEVVAHNGKYDLQVLMRTGVIHKPRLHGDTMLASYVLDERPGQHGLKVLAAERHGAPDYDRELRRYTGSRGSYALVPRDVLYRYNAVDASETYQLWDELSRELEQQHLRRVHDYLVSLSTELLYVEYDGIRIDPIYLDKLTDEYAQQLELLEQVLSRWVANPRSPQQLKASFRHHFKLALPSTNVETLTLVRKHATGELAEFLDALLTYRKTAKLFSTYVQGARKRLIDGRLYPTYLIHGTVFGRLAARNPNIHNVPRGDVIKRLYVPDEGNVFVQCDYSQAELRVMACEARDPYLREVFTDPSRDIHNEVSDTLYGVGGWSKEQRVRTKAFVFGSAYGREPYSIAREFGIPLSEAERLYHDFLGMIPEVVKWRQFIHNEVFRKGKALENKFGRKRRFRLITRENKPNVANEALAFIPQATANDICLMALMEIRKAFGWGPDAPKIRITVHDSIVAECRQDQAADVGPLMSHIMQQVAVDHYSDFVPFLAAPEYGTSWGELEDMDAMG